MKITQHQTFGTVQRPAGTTTGAPTAAEHRPHPLRDNNIRRADAPHPNDNPANDTTTTTVDLSGAAG
jgi:hypothetical protein